MVTMFARALALVACAAALPVGSHAGARHVSLDHLPAFTLTVATELAAREPIECRAWARVQPNDDFNLAPDAYFQARKLVNQSGCPWVSFALFHDVPVTVSAPPRLYFALANGDTVSVLDVFAMTPCEDPWSCWLAPLRFDRARLLRPGDVYTRRFRDGRAATVLYAELPNGTDVDQVVGVGVR
jgi:hypothetical protein